MSALDPGAGGDAAASPSAELPPRLAEIIRRARGRIPGGAGPLDPPFTPAPTESPAQWLTRVREARAAHDAHALAWRAALDAAAAEVTGATLGDLLPPATRVTRRVFDLPTPNRAALTDRLLALLRPGKPAREVPATPDHALPVFVTAPADPPPSAPVILVMHGGAYWMGGGPVSSVTSRPLHDFLASRLGAFVLDVDYRLAPEHPFPASIIDALEVVDAIRRGIPGLPLDPARIAVIGTSSGGNAAAAATLADVARAPAQPLRALGLLVPSVDLTGPLTPDREQLLRAYAGDAARDDPWLSPARHDALRTLPPTFVATAQFDEVARGGALLADRTAASGGRVDHRVYPMTHTAAEPEVEALMAEHLGRFLEAALRAG